MVSERSVECRKKGWEEWKRVSREGGRERDGKEMRKTRTHHLELK